MMRDAHSLLQRHCQPDAPALDAARTQEMLGELDGWSLQAQKISRTFQFKNYYQTIAFVNAVAWMTHREDHHPDMTVGYNTCRVEYTTHSAGGLSANDFICAAKVDALFKP